MEENETTLIQRCQAGDKDAFGGIVRKYAALATGTAYAMLGCREDARDASQEAFVRAWRHIRRFRAGTSFRAWYGRILRNVCISRLRRRARRRTVALTDGHADGGSDADPTLLAVRTERSEHLWQAIRQLPIHHREVIVLNHFNGMAYKDIAEALGIPIGTVMSRLHNARQALREKLAGVTL
jgi:RNA polymerase sigma-70 factor (ECF subfamily)